MITFSSLHWKFFKMVIWHLNLIQTPCSYSCLELKDISWSIRIGTVRIKERPCNLSSKVTERRVVWKFPSLDSLGHSFLAHIFKFTSSEATLDHICELKKDLGKIICIIGFEFIMNMRPNLQNIIVGWRWSSKNNAQISVHWKVPPKSPQDIPEIINS